MHYLLVTHRLSDFDGWHRLLRAHAQAQRDVGLHLLHVLRDVADPTRVVAMFRVDDLERARAFTEAPAASDAGREAGVISVEMSYWTE
jgi:hypothetical protein